MNLQKKVFYCRSLDYYDVLILIYLSFVYSSKLRSHFTKINLSVIGEILITFPKIRWKQSVGDTIQLKVNFPCVNKLCPTLHVIIQMTTYDTVNLLDHISI